MMADPVPRPPPKLPVISICVYRSNEEQDDVGEKQISPQGRIKYHCPILQAARQTGQSLRDPPT